MEEELKIGSLVLEKFPELPNGKWTMPRFTNDFSFFAAKCIYPNEEKEEMYIWKPEDQLTPRQYFNFSFPKIYEFQFDLDSQTFVILIKNNNGKIVLSHHKISSGNCIRQIELEEEIDEVLTSTFSVHSRFFAVGTKNLILIFDLLKGKIIFNEDHKSDIKSFRDQFICTIDHSMQMDFINLSSKKIIKRLNLRDIANNPSQVIGFAINPEKDGIIIATQQHVYQLSFDDEKPNPIINFDNQPAKVFINNNCSQFVSTDLSSWDLWNENGEKYSHADRQPFNEMKVFFDSNLLLTIDDAMIVAQPFLINGVAKVNMNKISMRIYLGKNPKEFTRIYPSTNQLYVLSFSEENEIFIYSANLRECIYKWKQWSDDILPNLEFEDGETFQ